MIRSACSTRIDAFCIARTPLSAMRVTLNQSRLSSLSRARSSTTSQPTPSNVSTSQQNASPSIIRTQSPATTVSFATSAPDLDETPASSSQSSSVSESPAYLSTSSAGNSSSNRNSSPHRTADPLDISDLLPKSSKASRSDGIWDSILAMSTSGLLPGSTQNDRWEKHHEQARKRMAETRLEAGKYAGRSVSVTDFVPLQIAFGRLGRLLTQNNVRKELRLVERYEKPTNKRRRLKSERHRRRFAEMVGELHSS
jgi:ribosomal protein S21